MITLCNYRGFFMSKNKTIEQVKPEVELTLLNGEKVTAVLTLASLVAYEMMTGHSILALKVGSAKDAVDFYASLIYQDKANENKAELAKKLTPEHWAKIPELYRRCIPLIDNGEEEEEQDEGKDSPQNEEELERQA